VKFVVSDEEHAVLIAAAERSGRAKGAFAAEAALAAARNMTRQDSVRFGELIEAIEILGRRIDRVGANLNQAVARLNATGRYNASLVRYAEYVADQVRQLDDLAEYVRKRFR
jgi:hypothetical protein